MKPLDGIRVLDLTRVLAGPYCTMLLRELGAEVIKIERPGAGDDARHFTPFLDEGHTQSAYFMSINGGKESVTLDLKHDRGRDILRGLLKEADVLVENFRPGTLAKLGFGEEELKALNPRLIYASASGFGHSGPDSGKAAYDMIIQALSGIMSITGTEEGQRVRVGASISDIVTGMFTALGIVSALLRRTRTDRGGRVDVAMLDSTVAVLENAIARYQVSGEAPTPLGARHPSITPFESFPTADSEIIIAAGNDKLFAALCATAGDAALAENPRFASNAARTEHFRELREALIPLLRTDTTANWVDRLTAAGVPCARVNDVSDLFESEQLAARDMLVPVEGAPGFKVAGNPVKLDGMEAGACPAPPALGEHTEGVLKDWLGVSDDDLAELRSERVIGTEGRSRPGRRPH